MACLKCLKTFERFLNGEFTTSSQLALPPVELIVIVGVSGTGFKFLRNHYSITQLLSFTPKRSTKDVLSNMNL